MSSVRCTALRRGACSAKTAVMLAQKRWAAAALALGLLREVSKEGLPSRPHSVEGAAQCCACCFKAVTVGQRCALCGDALYCSTACRLQHRSVHSGPCAVARADAPPHVYARLQPWPADEPKQPPRAIGAVRRQAQAHAKAQR